MALSSQIILSSSLDTAVFVEFKANPAILWDTILVLHNMQSDINYQSNVMALDAILWLFLIFLYFLHLVGDSYRMTVNGGDAVGTTCCKVPLVKWSVLDQLHSEDNTWRHYLY